MDTQVILILITAVVALYAVYAAHQKGEVLTPGVVVNEVKAAQPVAVELMEVAQIAVNAVEELRRQGKIQSNDEAFNYALNYMKKWIPDEWEVDNEDIIATINAAVLVASAIREQIDSGKGNVTIE